MVEQLTFYSVPVPQRREEMEKELMLYEGDHVELHWSDQVHRCTVYGSKEICTKCGTALIAIDPPWGTWKYVCVKHSALTVPHRELEAAMNSLPPTAIGVVSSVSVMFKKVIKKERR